MPGLCRRLRKGGKQGRKREKKTARVDEREGEGGVAIAVVVFEGRKKRNGRKRT
jgi:hypothetical protein